MTGVQLNLKPANLPGPKLCHSLPDKPHPPTRPLTMAGDDHAHHPSDAIKAGLQASAVVGTTGFFISALQNALHKNNIGAMAVFTRSGGNIAVFGTAPQLAASICLRHYPAIIDLCEQRLPVVPTVSRAPRPAT